MILGLNGLFDSFYRMPANTALLAWTNYTNAIIVASCYICIQITPISPPTSQLSFKGAQGIIPNKDNIAQTNMTPTFQYVNIPMVAANGRVSSFPRDWNLQTVRFIVS